MRLNTNAFQVEKTDAGGNASNGSVRFSDKLEKKWVFPESDYESLTFYLYTCMNNSLIMDLSISDKYGSRVNKMFPIAYLSVI